ncbi:phosphopantetheine-binding protein [Pelagibacterium lacus]|uniref:Phosphopantetheine-binding protein n=1 Tax=Pelagibacterium lacus TaxID=2282655 RepID=A0A369W3J0_9HYPH|nr:phosphopantetheine-binding protein [Pelagibacterium lacus]RDE07842.1 phosphopantetheine-binding protein [Pelagibacterium lacus]
MTLTLETMRADIARMLHDDPRNIGLDDNLMDLGLDSMRAMNLVLAWSEAGVDLDFSALAEKPTLAGWWALAQARQDAK